MKKPSKNIKKIIKETLSNYMMHVHVGDMVNIPKDLTEDPLSMQGKSGKLVHKNKSSELGVVEFENGQLGIYSLDTLTPAYK